jgi:hypothetical protein
VVNKLYWKGQPTISFIYFSMTGHTIFDIIVLYCIVWRGRYANRGRLRRVGKVGGLRGTAMDPQSGSSKPREPEEQVLPPSEQLLKRIDELEVSHAYLKEEMAKLLDSHEAEAEATAEAEAEAEAESKAEAAVGAAAGTGTLNSQPRPFNRKSSELRSYSPGRAQYESSQRSHRVASSSLPQRSHSVSPQRLKWRSRTEKMDTPRL